MKIFHNILLLLLFSCDYIKLCRFDSVVLSGVSLMLCACINWLKLVSFVHANYDMRSIVKSTAKVKFRGVVFSGIYISISIIGVFWSFGFRKKLRQCLQMVNTSTMSTSQAWFISWLLLLYVTRYPTHRAFLTIIKFINTSCVCV